MEYGVDQKQAADLLELIDTLSRMDLDQLKWELLKCFPWATDSVEVYSRPQYVMGIVLEQYVKKNLLQNSDVAS